MSPACTPGDRYEGEFGRLTELTDIYTRICDEAARTRRAGGRPPGEAVLAGHAVMHAQDAEYRRLLARGHSRYTLAQAYRPRGAQGRSR